MDLAPAASTVLGDMNNLLAHRGPDGSGVSIDGALYLGHPRFVVLDMRNMLERALVSNN